MVRTQVSLSEDEYKAAKREAQRLGISLAELLHRFSDQDLTLADAVGLHLMAAQRIRSCWSTDFHLRLTGVPLIIDQY